MRISHNLVIDHFRKSNRIPIFESKDEFDIFQIIGDDAPNIESNMIDRQVVEDLEKVIIVELPGRPTRGTNDAFVQGHEL